MKTLFLLLVLSSNLLASDWVILTEMHKNGKTYPIEYEYCEKGETWRDCCEDDYKGIEKATKKELKDLVKVCLLRYHVK